MTMEAGWMRGVVFCLILKLAVSQILKAAERRPVELPAEREELEKFEPVQEPVNLLDLQQSNALCEEGLESLTVFPETRECHDLCIASGDPHFNTFDCVKYEYHGRCSYTLVKNCGGDLANFEIIGEFHRMRYHRGLSIIKSLLITCEGTNIEMDAEFNVLINGERVSTAITTVSFAQIQRYCNAVVVTMTNGITIYWSSPYRAMIKIINSDVDATLAGNLCGLCGNNNDIKFDDLTARNKSLVSDVVVIGDSWRTNEKCGLCKDCENNLCQNNPQNYQIAQKFCSFFLQVDLLPCGNKSPMDWYDKCVNILCAALPETDGFCHLVYLYLDVCEGAGIRIQIELPKPCYVDPCEPDPCKPGGTCQRVSNTEYECECMLGYWGPHCEKTPPCEPNPCENGGTCINEGSDYRCICPFAVWGGPTCTVRCYVCWACGDPHYYTFDGVWYDFQGTCMYTLAKSSAEAKDQFEVVTNNVAAYWNPKVSITREVYVFLDFGKDGLFSFCFRYHYFGVLVNHEYVSLPYTNQDSNGLTRVSIRQSGMYTLLSTNFGLYIVWNGVHCVCVVVPESYINQVNGLCGLLSRTRIDDWTKPDGTQATSENEFGHSWAANPVEFKNRWGYDGIDYCPGPPDDDPVTCVDNPKFSLAEELCAFLNEAENGPFDTCFTTVKATSFYANCLYDICAGAGMDSVCDDMVNYVQECKNAGVYLDGSWRDMVPHCRVECDDAAGMEYSYCGSACPASCAEKDAPAKCGAPCVEGCFCKPGLLWTPHGCVPEEDCGCNVNGVYYSPGDQFISPDCGAQCECRMGGLGVCIEEYGPCHDNAECTVRNGQRGCYCKNGFYGDGFKCIRWSLCQACGDPHYKTFDGKYYDFQGKCRYTLVKSEAGEINFEVVANHVEWAYNPLMAVTRELYIAAYGLSIDFRQGTSNVVVNGQAVRLPYYFDKKLVIYRSCIYTVLITDFGLQIIWNGRSCVYIRLPDTFEDKVGGLCGFFNGDVIDDFKSPEGKLIAGINDFGNSWRYGSGGDCEDCTDDSCPITIECDPSNKGDVCSALSDPAGPFKVCHDVVSPEQFEKDCKTDACASTEGTNECEHFEAYAAACREEGTIVYGWRDTYANKKCAINCGPTMQFQYSATPCQPTCAISNFPNNCSQNANVEGCVCLDGLVLSGDECVEPTQCGCLYEGIYYEASEVFFTSDCKRCTCFGNNEVRCEEPLGCGTHATCGVQDGVRGCICDDGYTLAADKRNCMSDSPCNANPCKNGGQCMETADLESFTCTCPYGQWTGPTCNIRCYACYACGDPHYLTFDGRRYDFQGRCRYTLAKSLDGAPGDFEVVAKNVGSYYGRVSYTREICVYITHGGEEKEICFQWWLNYVIVNGVVVNIPYQLDYADGTRYLSIRKIGFRTVLETDFGLIVEWFWSSCVRLFVPETYLSYTAGLCGKFNGNADDDLSDPDNHPLTNPNDFGNSWVVGECDTPCDDTTCSVDPCKDQLGQPTIAQMRCSHFIKENEFSVFKDCFRVIDPKPYFDDCVYDMCVDNNNDVLCEHFTLYATMCREYGVNIMNWRASIPECPQINCGENMVYEFCGGACPATCGDREPMCNIGCVECCQCVTGYILSAGVCVQEVDCGCTQNGIYYQLGETVVSDDCAETCTCGAGGIMDCISTECDTHDVCEVRNNVRGCYCPKSWQFITVDGVCQPLHYCYACGDPHYRTFDGLRYNYMGRCSYVIAQSTTTAPAYFLVVGDNIPWVHNPRATATRYLHIHAFGRVVQFSWDTSVVLVDDDAVTLPYSFQDQLWVDRFGYLTVLWTDFGLRVFWDGYWCVYIQVPATFTNNVEGLCGTLNGDTTDDFTNPQDQLETLNSFGDSWVYGDELCEKCTPETCLTDPCGENPSAAEIADEVCFPFTDPNGPFGECLDTVTPANDIEECRFDVCADPQSTDVVCSYLQQYADDCAAAGIIVKGWRDRVSICAIECPNGMIYSDCGGCPATCANPLAPKQCDRQCVQGCQCPEGLLQSGDSCVLQEECGCKHGGRYYKNGERFITSSCNMQCTCRSGGVNCVDIACDDYADCKTRNGVRGCYCRRPQYVGDGFTCSPPCENSPCHNGGVCINADNNNGYICQCPEGHSGVDCSEDQLMCSASGDPHYVSFDGLRFDFQGDCQYVLTQNCSSDIPYFQVIVDNQKYHPLSTVSLTRTVTIKTSGETIFFGQGRVVHRDDINGLTLTVPVVNNNYSIKMRLGTDVVFTEANFGLVVEWNGYSTVRVKVPSSFGGFLCGLCGNGNGDRLDDFLTPNGIPELDINAWGHSWNTEPNCEMCDNCLADDACKTVGEEVIEVAENVCHVIKAIENPGFGELPIGGLPGLGELIPIDGLPGLEEFPIGVQPEGPIDRHPAGPPVARRRREVTRLKIAKRSYSNEIHMKSILISDEMKELHGFATMQDNQETREKRGLEHEGPPMPGEGLEPEGPPLPGGGLEPIALPGGGIGDGGLPRVVYIRGLNISWSASRAGVFTVNTTAAFQDGSSGVSGSGLWKESMYGSATSDGSGGKFQLNEQILSISQQNKPVIGGANIEFIDSRGELDLNEIGCEKDYRYVCFDFMKGDNPIPEFDFESFQADTYKITLCSDICPPSSAPSPNQIIITGLEVRINVYSVQPVKIDDQYVANIRTNITVHLSPSSPDVTGTSLWKASMYASTNDKGEGDKFQLNDNVLTETQQSQSYVTGGDLFFLQAPGEIDFQSLGCGEYKYLCTDFQKGDPHPDFDFKTLQTPSHKFTVCVPITCQVVEEPTGEVPLDDGFVLVADLDAKSISIAGLRDLTFQTLPLDNLLRPVAISYDPVSQRVFWTDVFLKTIESCDLDGSGRQKIIQLSDTSVPDGLFIDVVHRQIYWTDTGLDVIEKANLDGNAREKILQLASGSEPRAIVVDPNERRIFWTDWGVVARIECMNMDGTGRTTLVDDGLLWPNGLTIDFKGGRMYWADAGTNKIEYANLNGDDRQILLNFGTTSIHPFAVGVHNDTIIWSDWNFQQLLSSSISNPNPTTVGSAVFRRAGGMHIQYGGCWAEDGEVFIPEGHEYKNSQDPCKSCVCIHKQITCYTQHCLAPVVQLGEDCRTVPVLNQCCPLRVCNKDCVDGYGNIVPDGTQTNDDPCSQCVCREGEFICLAVICPKLFQPARPGCTEVILKGQCCPTWQCLSIPGPFIKCHDVIDSAPFFNDCIYDWCATQDYGQLCEDIAAYAEACQRHGIEIGYWRDIVDCPIESPANAHYELCPSACQPSCANPSANEEPCRDLCREGFVCDPGYIFKGDSCVQPTDCGVTQDQCPPEAPLFTCLVDPCDVATCHALPNARCESNYCGGCNAIFYDEIGNRIRCDSFKCPVHFESWGNKCYYFQGSHTALSLADFTCGNLDSVSVLVESQGEANFLASKLQTIDPTAASHEGIWVRCTDAAVEGQWTCDSSTNYWNSASDNQGFWEWDNGEPAGDDCLILGYNAKLKTAPCQLRLSFNVAACEITMVNAAPAPAGPELRPELTRGQTKKEDQTKKVDQRKKGGQRKKADQSKKEGQRRKADQRQNQKKQSENN